MSMFTGSNEEYEKFVNKFKPKLTTDDCYTPENIYCAVRDWVFEHYDLPENTKIVRPFWPGGDYQNEEYTEGCVVIDNPPFSILGEIEKWYLKRNIQFFLFAPALTLFKKDKRLHYVIADAEITYENGAVVKTAFVTNISSHLIESAPDLSQRLKQIDNENRKQGKNELPKYEYPACVLTASMVNRFAKYGIKFAIDEADAICIGALDAQKEEGKAIYGKGFLLSEKATVEKSSAERDAVERAAVERAAAKKSAATIWELSEREKLLQTSI